MTAAFSHKVCALAFYIGIPALTAVIFGVNHSGSARYMTAPAGIGYWFGVVLILWLLLDLATRLTLPVTRRFGLPVWAAAIIASLLVVAAFDPFLSAYSRIAFPVFAPNENYVQPRSAWDLASRSPGQLISLLVVPLYWTICLFIAKGLLRYPGYLLATDVGTRRSEDKAKGAGTASVDTSSGLFALLPIGIGTDIISLHAEDHYVRVRTRYGEALIRYRFSDALNEVAGLNGFQIHRSHWVRSDEIARVRSVDGRKEIELKNGNLWPVSRSYIGVLRSRGLA